MKRITKTLFPRLVALGLTVVILLSVSVTPALAISKSELNDLKNQAEELDDQGTAVRKKLNRLKRNASSKLEEKALLEQQVGTIMSKIAVTEDLIAALDVQIEESRKELEEASAKEKAFYEEFCDRFREMEERGTLSYWSVLFGSTSFSDFLDRMIFVNELVTYDNELMEQLTAIRQQVEDTRNELVTSQAEQKQAKIDLEEQQKSLVQEEKAVEAALAEIEANQAAYAGQLEALEKEASQLDDSIADAQKEYDAQHPEPEPKPEQPKPEQPEDNHENGSSGMVWPTTSHRITSPFGKRPRPRPGASSFHKGIDIGAPSGSPIYAAAGGTVASAGYHYARGYYVEVNHGNGMRTVYMHCKALYVSAGAKVSAGQTIAAVGSTGYSTGPHLHFGVMVNGEYKNPMNYVG